MRSYNIKEDLIKIHLKTITSQFSQERRNLKYRLDETAYLILTKDERTLKSLRKYPDSPFPLLSNIEKFCNTLGQMNQDLLRYGIKTREKLGDVNHGTNLEKISTRTHLVYVDTANAKGNKYLFRQYKIINTLRKAGKIKSYWKLCWTLMTKSWTFRLACMNSWMPRWYKVLGTSQVRYIWTNLNKILNFETLTTNVYNVWIESPKGKWRQLGVPNKAWRLYLHMVNMFISYIYEPHLPAVEYDGFIFSRGCKSWWENLLWGDWFTKFSSIVEVDLSSGFPNLSRTYLYRALHSDGLVPPAYINLFLTHLSSPLVAASQFPTFESYVEHTHNSRWRNSNRSVHMGLGISPILFVITLNWALRQLKIKNDHLCFKWYADDGSFYFNMKGLQILIRKQKKSWIWCLKHLYQGENLFLSLLNELPLFKEAGLKLCKKKSGVVRIFGIWVKPYVSLGLKLYTLQSIPVQIYNRIFNRPITLELMAWTRGRGANPQKKQLGTAASRTKLSFHKPGEHQPVLDLYNTIHHGYKKYFGLLIALLYASKPAKSPTLRTTLKLIPGSLLWTLLKTKKQKKLNKLKIKLDLYNAGCKLNEIFLKINEDELVELEWKELYPNLKRELKIPWENRGVEIQNLSLTPCLKPEPSNPESDYFRKYSEINLTPDELQRLQTEYALNNNLPPGIA